MAQGLSTMMTVIDAVELRLGIAEELLYISGAPVIADANASESPPSSPSALISHECKRFVYRKNTLKSLKMRCLISSIVSSGSKRKAGSPVSSPG